MWRLAANFWLACCGEKRKHSLASHKGVARLGGWSKPRQGGGFLAGAGADQVIKTFLPAGWRVPEGSRPPVDAPLLCSVIMSILRWV